MNASWPTDYARLRNVGLSADAVSRTSVALYEYYVDVVDAQEAIGRWQGRIKEVFIM